jgi:hypothetical protein
MKWFRHLTTAGDDGDLVDLSEKFGAAGYGIYWRLVEIVGKEIKEPQDPPRVRMLTATWARRTYASNRPHFDRVRTHLEMAGKIECEFDGDYLIISIPKLLKYCDEWVQRLGSRSGAARDSLGTNSGATRSRYKIRKEREYLDLTTPAPGAQEPPAPALSSTPTPPPEPPPTKPPGNGPPPRDKCTRQGCNRRGTTRIDGKWYCSQDAQDVDNPPLDLGTILSDNEKFLNTAPRT